MLAQKGVHHSKLALKPDKINGQGEPITTQSMLYSVTYYLELSSAISIYRTSHVLPTNVQLVVWTL
jgi:hypothetical protein